MKTLVHLLVRRFKRSHQLTIRRSRIHYQKQKNTPLHTQLHFESILK